MSGPIRRLCPAFRKGKELIADVNEGHSLFSTAKLEIEQLAVEGQRSLVDIGVPDPAWGEAVKAVVAIIPGKEVTEQDLIEFCKDNIASYKKPKSVDFVPELPKNNYGKIVKRELRAKYWTGKTRSVI